jgi:tetratricopeptide (TPR) repeat protein
LPHDLAEIALQMQRPRQALVWSSGMQDADSLTVAGGAQWDLGKKKEAHALWLKALSLNPAHEGALTALAKAAISENNKAEALQYCKTLIEKNPNDLLAQYFLALNIVDPDKATSLFSDQDLNLNSITKVANVDEAKARLASLAVNQQAVDQFPNILFFYGLTLQQAGDLASSEKFLKQYIEKRHGSVLANRTLADVFWREGKTFDASAIWTATLENEKRSSKNHSEEAENLIAQGQFAKADAELCQALEQYPANYKALELVKSLPGKAPRSQALLEIARSSGAENASVQSKSFFQPINDIPAKLTELFAAAMLLFLALRKKQR